LIGAPTLTVIADKTSNAPGWRAQGTMTSALAITDPNIPRNITPTTASVTWSPVSGDINTIVDLDIKDIVQEIIDQDTWVAQNNTRFAIQASATLTYVTNKRVLIRSNEHGVGPAPQLDITYSITGAVVTESTTRPLNTSSGRATVITPPVPANNSIIYEIYKQDQDLDAIATASNPYPIIIRNGETADYENVIEATLERLLIWLPPYDRFKVRYKPDDWEWSQFTNFNSAGYMNSFDRFRILSGKSPVTSSSTDSSSGATITNT